MKASSLEYRLRFFIYGLLFATAFAVPLAVTPAWPNATVVPWMTKSSWLILSTSVARAQWLPFTSASFALLAVILVLLAVSAGLRLWASAYAGLGLVPSTSLQSDALLAAGPYRHTRNPLYLGTLLHTFAIAMLVSPIGAAILVPLVWVFQFRLALAEESMLAARLGQPYVAYKAAVPRFLPVPKPQVPASTAPAHWLYALAAEIYFLGAFVTLAVCGYAFNPTPIRQGLLIALGVWLIALALMPRPRAASLGATHA